MTGPTSRVIDVRVGSTTDGLTPVSAAERRFGAGLVQWGALAAVAAAALAADQVTKHIVVDRLALGEEVDVAGPLSLHHVQNTGIAFGLFSGLTAIVTALTALAVAWMLLFFSRSGARHPILPTALGLVIGGSASNLLDRVRLGHVTDFLDFWFWPAFNLADTFIVLGVAVLFVGLFAAGRPAPRRDPVVTAIRS